MAVQRERTEVVVVGSGATGSLMAAKLAQAGKQVTILEGGPALGAGDLVSSQIWARRLKWGGPPTASAGSDPIGHAFNTGWGTGGAALHHYAVWLRLHEEDFQVQSRFGVGRDWPIAYDDLRPSYDRIQEEVGIAGDANAEVWRPEGDPYPMPPVPLFGQGRIIQGGFEALGLRTSPLPLAVNTQPYKGRPACLWDGWCDAGCPIGALANPLAIYLPQALKAGAVLQNDSFVGRVLTDPAGTRATGVEYTDATGETRILEADLVVLAAFAVQNPRILLSSATDKHPDGLANSSGLLGTGLMTHTARGVYGLFAEPTDNVYGATGGQLLCQDDYAKDATKGYVGSYGWLIAQALKPNDLLGIANTRADLFGDPLHRFLGDAARHLAGMTLIGENLPQPENRVVLGAGKDRHGYPLASLTHAFNADDLAAVDAGSAQGRRVLEAAGAREVWLGTRGGQHILGGTVMGDDPATSVATSYGQTHDLGNLFVLGTGLFPTSGAVNPTYTIHALALRTAEYAVDSWAAFV